MRSKWKGPVISKKIQKKINAANQVIKSQQIKLKQLHLNSIYSLKNKQEFSFLTANPKSLQLINLDVREDTTPLKLENFESHLKEKKVKSDLFFSKNKKSFDPLKSFSSKKKYFYFKKKNKYEKNKEKELTDKKNILNSFSSTFENLYSNDSDIKNIVDIEKYTGISSNKPIIINKNNFSIVRDSANIVFSISTYINIRFLLIKDFMVNHKFGEFIFNRKLGKKKTKKKTK